MSTIVTIHAHDLLDVCSTLKNLVPSGSLEIPLGIKVVNGEMYFTCTTGVNYQTILKCDEDDVNLTANVLYYDISMLIPSSGLVSLEFLSHGVNIIGDGFLVEFNNSYSIVEDPEFPDVTYRASNPTLYSEGLKNLLNMGLNKLYSLQTPIVLLNDIALQMFPNTWVQVRVSSLNLQAILDYDHAKLLLKFSPTQVAMCSENNTVLLKNGNGVLQIPYKPVTDATNITALLEDLNTSCKFSIEHYLDKLRNVSKLNPKSSCKLAVFETGIKTTIKHNSSSVEVATGDITGSCLKVVHLPIQLWLTLLRGLGSSYIEILTGGDKLCLRTQATVIVTRVLH